MPDHAGPGRLLPFDAAPCRCVKRHRPRPVLTEQHHVFPKGLQHELWGMVRDPHTVPLCPTAHANVHAVLDALLAGRDHQPVNPTILRLARQGYDAYQQARGNEAAYSERR